VLEQKSEIERLNKKEAEDQQAIQLLEGRLKTSEGMSPPYRWFLNTLLLFVNVFLFEFFFPP
jgi:hypothetical protein